MDEPLPNALHTHTHTYTTHPHPHPHPQTHTHTYTHTHTHITFSAVVASLHTATTAVAGVDEVGSLVVQLIEHGLCGGLGPAQGGELPVPLSGHGQEGVTAVHEVTGDELVWVRCATDGRVAHCRGLEEDHEEYLE